MAKSARLSTKTDPEAASDAVTDRPLATPEASVDRPTHDEIATMAYLLYLAKGARDGYAEEDWFEAERALGARTEATAPQVPEILIAAPEGTELGQDAARM